MRTSRSLKLLLVLLLCTSHLSVAQTPINCDQLRVKIGQLERMDANSMSPSIQQMYRESLLKLYTQFSGCLQQDISSITAMQKTVAGTDAAAPVEERLRALTKEKSDIEGKIVILRIALNISDDATNANTVAPQPESAPDNAAVVMPKPQSMASTPQDGIGASPQGELPSAAAAAPVLPQISGCLPPTSYEDAPLLLTDIAMKSAADAVRRDSAERVIFSAEQMILYTIVDAASPDSSKLFRSLEAYQYLSETGRTDKQLGASAKSEGAVSAIEKPGFARLLGFAVEHGAINKKNDGTNLTLSTSLYSLYMVNNEDTAETYARAGVLNRVGLSATFAVNNKANDLANASRSNLSEWSAKARLFGDRSTRSTKFRRFWEEEVQPLIVARLQAIGSPIEELSKKLPWYVRLRLNMRSCLRDAAEKRMREADYQAATPDVRKKVLSDLLLGYLKSNVYDRVKSGQLPLGDDAIALIETRYVPNLRDALDNLKTAGGVLDKKLAGLNTGPLGTFAYTNHRTPTGSDYSETKFLFEQDKSFFRPLKLNGNFGLTFYHNPDATLRQQTLRDVTAALSFEGSKRSPFTEDENLSKVTFSFVGSYERLFENRRMLNRKPDIATAQFLVEVPFIKGFSLPFSLTYSNATEEERKRNVRFNFGMRLDTDKLFDLLRAATPNR
ncbi:MAG: hypothetical protein QOE33_3100 [Acidobacteriota bacterium]|nr:hypothetical protein [Acidobacteriota bacterium]